MDEETRRPCGIVKGHAYGISAVFEIEKPEQLRREGKQSEHRLLRVRNPYGFGEWLGKWSDKSEELEDPYNVEKIMAFNNSLPADEQFDLKANDGQFFINYKNWRYYYNKLFVAVDFPDDWTAVRFESNWTPQTSGGLPLSLTPE